MSAIKVLLVEDSASDAYLLRETLQRSGAGDFQFVWLERLEDALERLRAEPFDVLLLDLGLPDSFGPDTYRRAQAAAPRLPIVVLTGSSDEAVGLAAVHEGVQEYLVKGEAGARQTARAIRYAIERKQAQEQLRQQREWLRVTLSSIGDAVLASDTEGRITFLNPVAAELTGWPEPAALGRPVQDVFRTIDEETREAGEHVVGRVLREQRVVCLPGRTLLVTRDGREIPIADSAAPIRDSAGNLDGVVLVFHDVTEQRRAQEALRNSEQSVRRKLESILSPEGDIGNLELRDLIDIPAIQSLLDDFYRLAHIPMAVGDLAGRVLVGVGWQEICTRFHRVHPETCGHCIESDTQLTSGIQPGASKLYKCRNNMWDVATPLVVGGRRVGNVFSGQFFFDDEPLDLDFFRAQAARYGFDERAYLAALAAVPRLNAAAVDTALSFLSKFSQLVSLLSYSNLKLARSLSERDALTASLKESADRLRRAQEIAHVGSWELDLLNERLSWSDEVYRIYGLQPQEFAATYDAFLQAVHPEDRASVDAAYSGSLAEGRDSYELAHRIVRRASGEIRWVHQRCEHIRAQSGNIVRSIGMVQDITERKQAEDALRNAQKLESIGVLAGGIAHDFNNLLVGVIGNASLAQDMLPHGSPAQEMLRRIVQSGEQAAHLTRQMLAYAGKGRFIVEPVNLSAVVREASRLIQSSISKKITMSLQLEPDIPLVESDPSQMQQVFMNLAINAAEAIGDGPGLIAVATGEAAVHDGTIRSDLDGREVEPGKYVFLEVRDTGTGIAEAEKAKIFDPFFTTKFQGRGLGLAAVAGIVRAQLGAVQLTTAPGAGATFRVLFPAMAARTAVPAAATAPEPDLRGEGTVLVVDDERVVREFAKASLERQGYEVLVAESGSAAVDLVRSDGDRIRLVVLDLSMPGMSGQETLPLLREIKPGLDVIVSSGYSQAETLRAFKGAEVSGCIQKPYTVRELAREIRTVLVGGAAHAEC